MKKSRLSRRDFLSISGATTAGVLLTACVPAAAPGADSEPMAEATMAPAEEGAMVDDDGTMTFNTGSPWGTYSPFRPTYQYGYSSNTPAMLTHSRLFRSRPQQYAAPGPGA